MMEIKVFASVEDMPSKEVLVKIVNYVNEIENGKDSSLPMLLFEEGTPFVVNGYGKIKTEMLPAMKKMAEDKGICSIILVDLDADASGDPCAPSLIRRWFAFENDAPITIHPKLIFRVAVRETEAWLMADKKRFAKFMKMPIVNVPKNPDTLRDPKKKIFELIDQYCRRQRGRMLPSSGSHIGPDYNPSLCQYIQDQWRPKEASLFSDSLKKTILSLRKLVNPEMNVSILTTD